MAANQPSKLLFVEIINGPRQMDVEVNLEALRNEAKNGDPCDQELLVNALCEKKPGLASFFRSDLCSFAVESQSRPGKFVELGFKSPIKNATVRCTLPQLSSQPLRQLNVPSNIFPDCTSLLSTASLFRGVLDENGDAFNLMTLGDSTLTEVLLDSNSRDNTPVRRGSPSTCLMQQEPALQPSTNTLNSEVSQSEQITSARTPIPAVSGPRKSATFELACSGTPRTRKAIEQVTEQQDTAASLSRQTQSKENSLNTQQFKSRAFDMGKFEPPTYFGGKINQKLNNGVMLTIAEESVVSREYYRSMRRQTRATLPASIRAVVDLQYATYKIEHIGDEQATKRYWYEKIANFLYRMRQSDGERLTKNERPPKDKPSTSQPPGLVATPVSQDLLDEYPQHFKQMKELWIKSPASEGVALLFKLTHQVRRHTIMTAEYLPPNMVVSEFVDTYAPMLCDH